jgi:riboflavin synthase
MFTGLIETTGKILEIKKTPDGASFKVQANLLENDLKLGDSISINGACQTVTELNEDKSEFCFYSSYKTLELTNFSDFQIGDEINLERSMKLGDRLGGHMVSGHVDGVGIVKNRISKDDGKVEIFHIEVNKEESKYILERGSIAVDGISLTVVSINSNLVELVLIPETIKKTNSKFWNPNKKVNIETDSIARYVEKFVQR